MIKIHLVNLQVYWLSADIAFSPLMIPKASD